MTSMLSNVTLQQNPLRPSISIVICTKDRPADLVKAIASLRASCSLAKHAEVVVIEESAVPTAVSGVRYLHYCRQDGGLGKTRNRGIAEASGDLIVFYDDDCEAETEWLERLVAPLLNDHTLVGTAGAVMVRECNAIGYAENILGFPGGGLRYVHEAMKSVMPIRTLSTCNCVYRRLALEQVGGFPEETMFQFGGEDAMLAERMTRFGPCVYVPDAVVYHRPRGSFGSIFQWFMRRGASDVAILHGTRDRAMSIRFLLRGSWTLRVVLLAVICWLWPAVIRWLPVCALFYVGAILWRFRFARLYATHRSSWWLVPFVKLTMDLGAEVGRLRTLFYLRIFH